MNELDQIFQRSAHNVKKVLMENVYWDITHRNLHKPEYTSRCIFVKWTYPNQERECHQPLNASLSPLLVTTSQEQLLSWPLTLEIGFTCLWTLCRWNRINRSFLCLPSLLISIFVKYIHAVARSCRYFYGCLVVRWVNIKFIQSTVGGHLSCFQFYTMWNSAATNILGEICMHSCGSIPRSENTRCPFDV